MLKRTVFFSLLFIITLLGLAFYTLNTVTFNHLLKRIVITQAYYRYGIKVSLDNVELKYFLPSINLSKIVLSDNREDYKYNISTDLVTFNFSTIKLISGKLAISSIKLNKANINIELNNKKVNSSEFNLENIFSEIFKYKVEEVDLINSYISIKDKDKNYYFKDANFSINKTLLDKLTINYFSKEIKFNNLVLDNLKFNIDFNSKDIFINSFLVEGANKKIFFRGEINNYYSKTQKCDFNLSSQSNINLNYLLKQLNYFNIIDTVVPLDADLEFDSKIVGNIDLNNNVNISSIDSNIFFNNLKYSDLSILIPKLSLKLTMSDDLINVKEIEIFDGISNSYLKNISVSLKDYSVSGEGIFNKTELSKYLTMFNINECLSYFFIKGTFKFNGTLYPKFEIVSLFDLDISDFWLLNEKGIELNADNSLFNFDKANLYGFVTFGDQKVSFNKVMVTDTYSEIFVNGDINYAKGTLLDLDLYSEKFNFNSIKRISKIDIKGNSNFKANIKVLNEKEVETLITSKLNSFDLNFDKYDLGSSTMDIEYKDFVLSINNINTAVNYSSLTSNFKLYFDDNKNYYLNIISNKLYLEDLYKILNVNKIENYFPLGIVDINVNYDSNLLSDKFNSVASIKANDIYVYSERIDNLDMFFNIKNDKIIESLIKIKKINSYLDINPTGKIDDLTLKFAKNSINLSDFYFFKNKNLSMNAKISTSGDLNIKNKNITSNLLFNVSDYSIRNKNFGNAQITLKGTNKNSLINFNLFKNSIAGYIKYSDLADFNFVFKNFDFSPFLINIKDDKISSLLDGSINISYDFKNKLINKLNIVDFNFILNFNEFNIQTLNDLNINVSNSNLSFGNFVINSSYLDSTCSLNFLETNEVKKISGCVNAGFTQIFPSINFAKGDIDFDLTFNNTNKKYVLNGDIFTSEVNVSLKNYSNFIIDGKYSFKNSIMSVKDLSIESLNGSVIIDGDINFDNFINFKTLFPIANIEMDVNNFSLNYPKGVTGFWDGKVFLKGTKSPYLLKGTLFFNNGQFLKEFDSLDLTSSSLNNDQSGFIELDLDLKSKNEFIIKNDLFDGNLVFDLNIFGRQTYPNVQGKLNVISGQIFYNENIFKVNTGKVELLSNNTSTYQIDSEAKIGEYQVFLQVNGKNNEYELNIFSVPNLNETQLISLLAMGELNSEFNTESSEFSLNFGQSSFANKFSITKGLQDEAGIKVQFKYNKDANATMPAIALEKKLTNDLKLKFQKSLDESINKQEINVQYDLNRNTKIKLLLEEDKSDESKNDSTKAGFDFRFKFEF